VPASNLKLLTTAAAMDVLGPQYRFSTQLLSNGAQQGERLNGNLYLRGLGDPTTQFADYQALAAQLASQGVRQVQGDLVFDDSWFDAQRLGVDWAQDDESTYYGAQISALTVSPNSDFDAGTLMVTATAPMSPGQPVSVAISPATDYVQLSNRAVSGPGNSYGITRQHGTNLLQLTGALAPGKHSRQWVSVWEPTQLVANLFEQALAQQGIQVLGRRVIGGSSPATARLLAEHQSAPLQELITPLLKLSNNNMSEALLKAMGRQTTNAGTAQAGVAAVAAFMRRQGLDPASLNQVDGSGLSRRNLGVGADAHRPAAGDVQATLVRRVVQRLADCRQPRAHERRQPALSPARHAGARQPACQDRLHGRRVVIERLPHRRPRAAPGVFDDQQQLPERRRTGPRSGEPPGGRPDAMARLTQGW